MAVVASQLVGKVEIQGVNQAQADLQKMDAANKQSQQSLDQLQKVAKDASAILSNRFTAEVKNAQAPLQALARQADAAGLDVSKLASLQMKASESAAKLSFAQAQAAATQEKATLITNSGTASVEQIALAQARAAVAAENVAKAENAAGMAFERVKLEAGSLSSAMNQNTAKASLFSTILGGLKEKAETTSTSLLSGFKSAAGGILEFGAKLGQTAFGIQFAWQSIQGLGQALLGSNEDMEQTTVAFTQLLGSSQAAGAYLKQLQDLAASTPFEFPELANDAQQMMAFGFSAQDVIPFLTDIGDAMGDMGKGKDAVAQIVTVFGQMHAAGKLNAQDMMQITSTGVPAWRFLADAMHISVAEVQKMTTAGLIPADKAISMIRAGMHDAFGGGMQAQSKTFAGILSTIQDNAMAGWRAFTGPLFEQSKSNMVELGKLVSSKAFQDFAKDMGEKVGGALAAVSQFIRGTAIPAFQGLWGFLSQNVIPVFQTAGDWFQKFVGHGQAGIPIIAGLAAVIGSLLVGAFIALDVAISPVALVIGGIGLAVAGLTAAFLHFYNTSPQFRTFLTDTGVVLQQIGAFIVSTFTPVWQQLVEVWQSQIQPALGQLMATFKQMQPELKIVAEILGGVLLYQIGVLVADIGFFAGALAGIWKGAAEMIGGYVQIFSGYVQIIAGVVSFIVDLFTGKFSKLGPDLKVILGGVGEIFTGFGNVLKGIVDGIVGGVVGGFKGMGVSVIGYINDIVYGVQDKTKSAATAAQINTAQMKDKSIENAQKMNEGTQTNLINMRNGIEEQLKQTTDATQRHTLEMKLAAVNNSLEMAQKTGQNLVDMRYKSQEQLDLMKQGVDTSLMTAADKAKYHSLNMKDFYLQGVIAMDDQTLKKVDDMRLGILDELSRTTDGAKKHALEIQLTEVTHAEDTAKKVKDVHVQQRKDTESEMDKLKTSISNNSKSVVSDIQKWFGGIGKWFSDRWNEAWNGTTAFFGTIGKWFGDRWHDTQNVFAGIGGWFHDRWQEAWNGVTGFFGGIGKWFSDRWNEVMSSTKPFRDYMGSVFHTIWDILVALWGKLGQWFNDRWGEVKTFLAPIGAWFHDRFTEAWNAVVGAFQFLGKWFTDRWHDVQNIFGGVGQWFHDRWQEAWNKTVEIFTPIGKWFSDRWTDVKNIWGGIGQWFHDRGQEAWNKLTEIFGPIGKWFGDRWNEIKTNISNKWNEIKTDSSNIFKGIINGIIDQLNNGIQAFATFVNFFGQKLDDLHQSLVGTPGTIPMVKFAPIPHYASGTDSHPGGPAVLGEEGRELVFLPRGSQVVPNNITEMILSMTGGKIPGYADGIGDIGSKILSWVAGGAQSVLDNLIATMHISAPTILGLTDIASGMFNKVKDWALSWISGILPQFTPGGAVNISGTVRDWIAQAMALTGAPASWAGALGTIAQYESGGNPNAINLTDSNAAAGHPSQGLFQMIPSTFAAHMLANHTNIKNPIDNAASAIGYIRGRYGDVFHVPGIMSLAAGGSYVGYANGGMINEPILGKGLRTGTNYAFGEGGKKELVTPYVPDGVNLASQANPTINITVNVQPNDLNIDSRRMATALMPAIVDRIRYGSGIRI